MKDPTEKSSPARKGQKSSRHRGRWVRFPGEGCTVILKGFLQDEPPRKARIIALRKKIYIIRGTVSG